MAFLQILFHNNYGFYFQNIWIQCRFNGLCLRSNRSLFEGNLLRNGLGDDSYYVWGEKTIPYVIGEGFNETYTQNIQEAIDDYNRIFKDCIKWKLRTDEVSRLYECHENVL